MANLGLTEMLVIFILVVVFVGPDDLPELMKFLGRAYGKIRRASNELRRAFTLEVDKVEAEGRAAEIRKRREALVARRREETASRKAAEESGESLEPEPVPKPAPESEPKSEPAPETPEHTATAEEALEETKAEA
ncbi:MAG TPA: twin-arginine translocase TatA/TatE family subunit [Myxococcota bacterium]|nr:twin-arginine translocase TatA/TatE family subunit [Myxococcota bacterium]